jgi:hypothetical protein
VHHKNVANYLRLEIFAKIWFLESNTIFMISSIKQVHVKNMLSFWYFSSVVKYIYYLYYTFLFFIFGTFFCYMNNLLCYQHPCFVSVKYFWFVRANQTIPKQWENLSTWTVKLIHVRDCLKTLFQMIEASLLKWNNFAQSNTCD